MSEEWKWISGYEGLYQISSAKIASELTGVCQRNILQVASGEPFNEKGCVRKQAGGYEWKFAENRK